MFYDFAMNYTASFIITFSGYKIMLLYFNYNMYLIFTICLFVHVHACAKMCYYRYLLYTIKKKFFSVIDVISMCSNGSTELWLDPIMHSV